MTRWRQRIGADDLEALLAETIAVAVKTEAVSERQLERITVDSTVQTMSIRIGQAGYSSHFRRSRSSALAMTMSLRMTAVMANFLHFPVDTSCSYFAFMSGLKRVATTAGK